MGNTNARMLGARSVDTRYIHNASRSASVLFQGKWKLEILCAMRAGPVRVGQLSRLPPGNFKEDACSPSEATRSGWDRSQA